MRLALAILMIALPVLGDINNIIPATNRMDWGSYTGVSGGIPNVTTIFTTFTATATSAQINNALTICPSNQVVYLSNGVYTLSSTLRLDKHGVVLRGAGMSNTVLKGPSGPSYVVQFQTQTHDINFTNEANISSGYAAWQYTNITFSSMPTWLSVGDLIVMDELEDGTTVESTGLSGLCDFCGRVSGDQYLHVNFGIIQAINGNSLDFLPPANWPMKSGNTPQVVEIQAPLMRCGIESLTITNTGLASYMTHFAGARECWVKECELVGAVNRLVWPINSYRCEFRGSIFRFGNNGAFWTEAGYGSGKAYGMFFGADTGHFLVIDNIFHTLSVPIAMEGACAGHVIAYNYVTNLITAANKDISRPMITGHGAHPTVCLLEGNVGWGQISWDYQWGSASHNTQYRNRIQLQRTNDTTQMYQYCMLIDSINRSYYMSWVGNVIGTDNGWENQFDTITDPNSANTYPIRRIGSPDANGFNFSGFNLTTTNTMTWHLNWDYYTDTITTNASIGDTNIPASLLLAAKPSWFGILPWPPIDPYLQSSFHWTNIPAGYRYAFGTNPPAAAQGGGNPQRPPGLRRGIFRLQTTANGLPVDVGITNVPVMFTLQQSDNLTNWNDLLEVKFKTGNEWTGLLWDNTLADVGSRRFFRLREN